MTVSEITKKMIAYSSGNLHDIDGLDYQILVEADCIVNADKSGYSKEKIRHTLERVFRTGTGIEILRTMYQL